MDIENLTTRELNGILKSNFLEWYERKLYYEDISKFAKLAIWNNGASDVSVEDLIGKYPIVEEKEVERNLTEEDLEWIKFAKNNSLKYIITKEGVKIG